MAILWMIIYKQMYGWKTAQFACDFTMAKIRHIIFLVTTIAYVGSTNGGYYSGQSTAEIQNQNNKHLNTHIDVSSNQNHQPDLSSQNLVEKLNNEDISTRYELDQTVLQNINEEQYRSAVNQLESEVHKPENHYSNREQILPNTIQRANTLSALPTNLESNLLPNQHNGVQSVNSNQIISQSESIRTTHLRSFYPSLYPNYANIGTIPASNPLPLSAPLPQAQSVLPPANVVTLPDQRGNLPPLPLSAPPTLVSGQTVSNVQNVLTQANIGVLPAQSTSVHHLPLHPAPSIVANQIPVNYNVQHVLPQASAVIAAHPSPAVPLPLGPSQVAVNGKLPVNSGVHIFPPENSEILSAQLNLLPPPVSQQVLINGQQAPINFNVQSLPSLVPAGGQRLLNGDSVSNIIGQSLLPVRSAPAPIVTKDVYFHAAPPGFIDAPAPPPPPKKTYKIIFIKLPSQERRNAALIRSLYSQQATREDKTLIYVLVKKPEEPQVIVPQPKGPSEHEVIFVKYRNIKENSGALETNETELKHDDSLLQPGLANGH